VVPFGQKDGVLVLVVVERLQHASLCSRWNGCPALVMGSSESECFMGEEVVTSSTKARGREKTPEREPNEEQDAEQGTRCRRARKAGAG
jgi:hypothetical protein